MKFNCAALAALALTGVMQSAFADETLDTVSAWNGRTEAGLFGDPDTATFGQSITMGAEDGLLHSFTFYLGPLDLELQALVFEWDGAKALGAPVFAGTAFNIGDAFSGFKAVRVDAADTLLSAGKQYVLALTSSGLQTSKFNTNNWGALTRDAYAGGEFVFHNSGNDVLTLQAEAGWDCGDGCGFINSGVDLAFKAEILSVPAAPVPEPATYGLAIAGLVALGLRRRGRVAG